MSRPARVGGRGSEGRIVPLTDRILRVLPGPYELWLVVWSLLPVPNNYVIYRIAQITGPGVVGLTPPNPWDLAAVVLATFVSLWGSRKLVREFEAIRPAIAKLTLRKGGPGGSPIRGMGSVSGPLWLTLGLTAITVLLLVPEYGWRTAGLEAIPTFILFLPMSSFIWIYLSLLLGLHRLGGQRLALDRTPGDRTLGLRPVGGLAFTGFFLFALGFAPALVVTATSTPTQILNLFFFLLGVGLFLLSMSRLHGQMVEAKHRHMDVARRLYAEAYAPLARAPKAATLKARAPLLSAAEALEKRSAAISEWPFDQVLTGRIAIIVTSVVATVAARILLESFGL